MHCLSNDIAALKICEEKMEDDDLPQRETEHYEPSLADSIGQVFGSMIWIIGLTALVGGVIWLIVRWL